MLHWIELGQPDDSRLRKALSRSERVSVYAYGSGTNRWWEKSAEAISALPRVEVWQLPAAEVEALGTSLVRNSQVSIAISGGVLYVDVDGNTADFAPQRLAPTR